MARPASRTHALLLLVILQLAAARAGAGTAPTPGRQPAIEDAIARASRWLEKVDVDPFDGGGIPSLRLYTTEVEIWHRLWFLETDPARRRALEDRTIALLRRVLDEDRVRDLLTRPDGPQAFTEAAILATRCAQHGLDPRPLADALSSRREALRAEIAKVPPSIAALYAAYLPATGLDLTPPIATFRSHGMLAGRPPEAGLTLADVYYLTHEIFAYTDYGLRPLTGLSEVEAEYLLRVLPFYTILYLLLGNIDVAGELITGLHAAGMRDTYGYQEGIGLLLERQNPDGSFGAPSEKSLGHPARPADFLHPTMNVLTALLLERDSLRGANP